MSSFIYQEHGHTKKLAFHDADTDILADILARIVARMSACRSACHRNNFRKSRVSDVSARILDVGVGVGVVEGQLKRTELAYVVYKFGEIWCCNSGVYRAHFCTALALV